MGISVIVPTYNNEKYLKECIESIYRSGLDREYELLIAQIVTGKHKKNETGLQR